VTFAAVSRSPSTTAATGAPFATPKPTSCATVAVGAGRSAAIRSARWSPCASARTCVVNSSRLTAPYVYASPKSRYIRSGSRSAAASTRREATSRATAGNPSRFATCTWVRSGSTAMSSAVSPRSVQAAATSAGVRDGSSSRRAAGERVDTPAMSSATSETDRPPAASNASAIRAAHRASSAFSSRYAPKPPGSGGASTGTHPHRSRKPAHAFRTRTRSCSVTPSCAWAVAVNRRNRSGSALLRPVACAPVRRRCRARKVAVTGVGLIGAAVGSGSKAAALASSRGSHAAAMPTRVCSRSAARFRQAASSDRRWRSCEAWCRAIRTWSARSSRACARRTRSSYSTVLAVSKSRTYPPSKSRSAASAALRRGHALPRSASAACAAHAASRAAAASSNPNPTSHPHHQPGNV